MNLSSAANGTHREPGRGQVRPPGIWSPTTGPSKPARPRVDHRVVTFARHRFGMHVGSAFFGWLTSLGVGSLLVSLLGSAASTIGAGGALVVAAISFVAHGCGGYVAARMARSFGARQGLAVWLWGLAATLALAAVAAAGGARHSAFAHLGLSRLPIGEGILTTGAIVTLVATVLAGLAGAVLGGAAGTRRRSEELR